MIFFWSLVVFHVTMVSGSLALCGIAEIWFPLLVVLSVPVSSSTTVASGELLTQEVLVSG